MPVSLGPSVNDFCRAKNCVRQGRIVARQLQLQTTGIHRLASRMHAPALKRRQQMDCDRRFVQKPASLQTPTVEDLRLLSHAPRGPELRAKFIADGAKLRG